MQRLLKITNSPSNNRRRKTNLRFGQSIDEPGPPVAEVEEKLKKVSFSSDRSSLDEGNAISKPSTSQPVIFSSDSTSPSALSPLSPPLLTPTKSRRLAFFNSKRLSLDEESSSSRMCSRNPNADNSSPNLSYVPNATPPFLHRLMPSSPIRLLSPKTAFAAQTQKLAADFGDLEYMNTSNEGYRLTLEQCDLVREAWRVCNADCKEKAGVWIFKRIFAHCPHLKVLFDLHRLSDETQLDSDPQFKKHAQVFTDVLEMIVESVDALEDSLGPLLLSYGSKHVQFESGQGFRPEYWDAFAVAMTEYASNNWKFLKNSNKKAEALRAWRILVFFVVSKVKQGFTLEKKSLENRTENASSGKSDRKLSS